MRFWDNVLTKETENEIEKLFTSTTFEWFCMPCTVVPNHKQPETEIPIFDDHPNLFHVFYSTQDGGTKSKHYDFIVKHVLEPFCKKTGTKLSKILRIRANLLVNVQDAPSQHMTRPHRDFYDRSGDTNFKVIIYYVNDSDGPTFVFPDVVKPKKGRFIMFDNLSHAGSYPIQSNVRMVINFNIRCDQ